MLTGKSSLDTAVAALRHGAFDYLTKPCKLADLQAAAAPRGREARADATNTGALKRRSNGSKGKSQLVGDSPAWSSVRKLIAKVAPTEFHRADPRRNRHRQGTGRPGGARSKPAGRRCRSWPINCGALPENLIESELFGHRKGSFTGADEHRIGLFEVANGGTLFLDEIGELPKPMQAKLLRLLESGEIRRVGDNESFIVDVRVVCATHRDLDADGRRRAISAKT